MKKKFGLNEPDRSKWYIATGLMCVLVLPAFVFIVIFTFSAFKKSMEKNTAILYSGLAAFLFALTYFLIFTLTGNLREWEMTSVFILPQTALAVYLFAVYVLHARYANRLSRCLSLVQNDHITDLDELGYILGLHEKRLKRYVKRLIKMNRLDGAGIDEAAGEIVFTKSIWAKQRFVCPYCGAETTVDYGHTLVCEYCGQALPVKKH